MSSVHLMGQFMSDNHCDSKLVRSRRLVRVKKKGRFPISGQTPVLHRSRLEVWDGSEIYRASYINGESPFCMLKDVFIHSCCSARLLLIFGTQIN